MVLFGKRASSVLFQFLKNSVFEKKFLLPVNICPIVPLAFLNAGVSVEFIDIDDDTLCLNEGIVLEKLSKQANVYSGVMFNHSYGSEYNPMNFFKVIKEIDPRLSVIDDRCLCIPEFELIANEHVDLTLYSTGYAKIVDLGFGGFGFYSKPLNVIKENDFHMINEDHLETVIDDYKKSVYSESLFNCQTQSLFDLSEPPVKWLDYKRMVQTEMITSLANRKEICQVYVQELPKSICLHDHFQNWRFNILVSNKSKVLQEIFEKKLFASSHYPPLVPDNKKKEYPVASALDHRIINLFIDKNFSVEKAHQITQVICKNI